ncbi:MAG: hypothetical protein QW532_05060 [Archaeoglobaceae archaeon]
MNQIKISVGYSKYIVLVLIAFILTIPITYAIEPQIDFQVSVAGDGKLYLGDDTALTLLIENEAKITDFPANENTSQLLTLLTTAKDVRVELEGGYPISVETANAQIIGDLPAGRTASATFRVKIDENAPLGEYSIPVEISYTKVSLSAVGSNYLLSYSGAQKVTEYFKIKIAKKDYDFSAKVVSGPLKAGREGKVDLVIENVGEKDIKDAVVFLNVSAPILPNPDAISTYISELKAGEKISVSFKVFVSDKALSQDYPASLTLKFSTNSGQIAISKQIGLAVEKGKVFSVSKVESFLTPAKSIQSSQATQAVSIGQSSLLSSLMQTQSQSSTQFVTMASRGVVSVEFESQEDLQNVVAILSFDNQALQPENTPYIGNIKKGEKKIALFYVKSMAPAGSYRGSFLLKYRNELGSEVATPQEFVEVEVSPSLIGIEKVESQLGVGLKGDLRVSLKNKIDYALESVELYIFVPSFITTLSQSSYLQKLNPNDVGEAKFRLSVSEDALGGYYRLYILAKYKIGNAEDLLSIIEVPVFVAPKFSAFEVLNVDGELYPDSTGEIAVKIKNSGSAVAKNVVVELQVSPPLSVAGVSSIASMIGVSQPGVYFVGTMNPGDTAVAKFRIEASKDAGIGFYPATITLGFENEDGYKQKSNPITVSIEVKERPLLNFVTITTLALISFAIIAIARFARKRRKA